MEVEQGKPLPAKTQTGNCFPRSLLSLWQDNFLVPSSCESFWIQNLSLDCQQPLESWSSHISLQNTKQTPTKFLFLNEWP